MSRSSARCVLLFVGLILSIAVPRSSPAQTTPAFDKLQPLAFLAGSCWKGTFKGRTVTDEHCFTWKFGGRFLRDRHVVRGDSIPYEGETTYAWDGPQNRIVYWYIAQPGFYSHGQVESADGALRFRDNLVTSRERELRITWRRSGTDAYNVLVEEVTGGNARELWSMMMQRSRTAPE
ncbi:MAG: hypothetical protein QOK06_2850 [Acidimicrobiaceae bacterium]|jgi:hypothetical protein